MFGKMVGKVAIVTGGSRGIGREIALAFAHEGARVVVTSRTAGSGEEPDTAKDIRAEGGDAVAIRCDVSSREQVLAMVAGAVRAFGTADVLVNNAGQLVWEGLLQTPPELWESTIGTNLNGPYYCTMAVLPGMMDAGRGSIINLSSGVADSDHRNSTVYAVTKAGLDRMTIKLAAELREHGIAVNALRPGLVKTPGVLASTIDRDLSNVPTANSEAKRNIYDACIYLATSAVEPSTFFSGRVVDESEFGKNWP